MSKLPFVLSERNTVNEQHRLEAVNRYKGFHKSREKDLQEILMLASHICQAPIALTALMDHDTQWIKAKIGVEVGNKIPSEGTICSYVIRQNNVMVIEDVMLDERFCHLPIANGDSGIRFYAAANLHTNDGYNIGTLCVCDSKPGTLTDSQKHCLEALAKQIINLLELDLSMHMLNKHIAEIEGQNKLIKDSKTKLLEAYNSSLGFHLLVDANLNILAFNKRNAEFFKKTWGNDICVGHSVKEYADPETLSRFLISFNRAITGETVVIERIIDFDANSPTWWEINYVPALDEDDNIIGVSFNAIDISERKINEEKINAQNQRLSKISHIQSHEYRAPVSAILGIMSLIKEDNYEPNKEYLQLLDQAVKQLDEKINSVVNYTNQL